MNTQVFNDQKLIDIARYQYRCGLSARPLRGELLEKEKLTNAERNELLEFLDGVKTTRQLSMSAMKKRIFDLIGFKPSPTPTTNYTYSSSTAQGPVNRAELQAIMQWIEGHAEKKKS